MEKRYTTVDAFEQEATDDFDQVVLEMKDAISPVCSSSDWALAAYKCLKPNRDFEALQMGKNWFLWASGPLSSFHRAFQPLEFDWGFGTPLVGEDPVVLVEMLADVLSSPLYNWDISIFTGIPKNSELQLCMEKSLGKRLGVDSYDGCHCIVSSLLGGEDGFLSRRSKKFRTNLLQSSRKVREQGIHFEYIHGNAVSEDTQSLFQRILDVEEASWKHEASSSIFLNASYKEFYRTLFSSLHKKGRLRLVIASHEGRDIGYVFGGVLGVTYRGFQLGFHQDFSSLGIGNLVQWKMIQGLISEGVLDYDLGMDMEYKKKWGEKKLELSNVVLIK